jgi:hypothetical protein
MEKEEESFSISKEKVGIFAEDCCRYPASEMPSMLLSGFLMSSNASAEAVGVAALASVQQGAAST